MQPFTTHTGLVATLDRSDVDTDQIISKEHLKRIERTGYGKFLFSDWRYQADGSENLDFELNRPEFQGASVLVTRSNFGCGSSREHAPWALDDYGFRSIIAPSFADIFYNNCFNNGMLPIRLPEDRVDELFARVAKHPGYRLNIDLTNCTVTDEHGFSATFEVDPFRRKCLLEGLDQIGLTLEHEDRIAAFESARGL